MTTRSIADLRTRALRLAGGLLFLLVVSPAFAVTVTINNLDVGTGLGFDDPTPAAPVAGNPGSTVGEQRLNVFQAAADLWGGVLTSDVPIVVQATFRPLACTATTGVLGAAGTIQIFAGFPGAQWPATWYHSALANKLHTTDLTPGPPDPGLLSPPFNDDIVAFFNGDLGSAGCLEGLDWYYGLDNQEGPSQIDLFAVLMHELGHGLGFANFTDDATGATPLGIPDIYGVFTHDDQTGRQWNQMTDAERAASEVRTGKVVWNGPAVTAAAPAVLIGTPVLRVQSPSAIAGDFPAQAASYGPLPTAAGVTADVALFTDPGGDDPHDACEIALDPAVAGKIALIHRGSCTFALKSALAQLSGAVGVAISNNAPQGLPPMGGSELIPMTIPSIGISQAAGAAIEAALPGVTATILADPALGLSGADAAGFVRLYAPDPAEPGSSISHWDTVATPNLLMEPFVSSDLTTQTAADLDLTPDLLGDIGWVGGPSCPVGSDDSATVVVAGCDSGVENLFGPFTTFPVPAGGPFAGQVIGGCTVADLVAACSHGTAHHGDFVSCAARTTTALVGQGVLSDEDRDAIMDCVESAPLP